MDPQEAIDSIKIRLERKKLNDFEIFFSQSVRLEVEAKDGNVDSLVKANTSGASIRVLKEGKFGFAYSTDLNDQSLENMVDEAVHCASEISEDKLYGFPLRGQNDIPKLNIFDKNLSSLPEENKIKRAKELEEVTRGYDKRITKIRNATYGESSYQIYIFNTRGIDFQSRGTIVESSIMAIAEDGSDSQVGWDFDFNNFFDQLQFKEVGIRAAKKATERLGAKKIKTTKCPVVLDNVVSSEILGVLAPSFLAENLSKGKTLLLDKLDKKIFSSCIGIIDDGLLTGGIMSSPFDGEGTARQKTQLVKEGIIRHFLYDYYYGIKNGNPSTGNSSRSGVGSPPNMGISNFFIEKGGVSLAELLSDIKKGFLITEFMGVHTANSISGDFSLGAAGFWIENGKVTFPVKGAAVSGNIFNLLSNVEGVGNDLRFYGRIGAPSLRIKEMNISGE